MRLQLADCCSLTNHNIMTNYRRLKNRQALSFLKIMTTAEKKNVGEVLAETSQDANSEWVITKEEELSDLVKLTASRYKILESDAKAQCQRVYELFDKLYLEHFRDEGFTAYDEFYKVSKLLELFTEVFSSADSDLKRIQEFSRNLHKPVESADGWFIKK